MTKEEQQAKEEAEARAAMREFRGLEIDVVHMILHRRLAAAIDRRDGVTDELASVIAFLRKLDAAQIADTKQQDGARFALRTAIAGLLQGQHVGDCKVNAHGLVQDMADEVARVGAERDAIRDRLAVAEKLLARARADVTSDYWHDAVADFLGEE